MNGIYRGKALHSLSRTVQVRSRKIWTVQVVAATLAIQFLREISADPNSQGLSKRVSVGMTPQVSARTTKKVAKPVPKKEGQSET